MYISSTSNASVKQVAGLLKKGKLRAEADAYVVEGIRMVREIPKEDLRQLYISETFAAAHEAWKDRAVIVADRVFKTMTDTSTPQGILAVAARKHYTLDDLFAAHGSDAHEGHSGQVCQAPLILILESISDPGNLGTMLRMAEGAGASGLLMNRETVDIYNPKVVRSTMGSIFRVPFVYTDHLEDSLKTLQNRGVQLFAAHLKGRGYHFETSYTKASGIMIGNEAAGLSDRIASMADTYIKIPMDGQVESLNAAMAATIIMYEAKRQRLTASK